MRIVSVVGTRPQLIKAAALLPALRKRQGELRAFKEDLLQKSKRNRDLANEVHRLTLKDPELFEALARRQGYARPGETVYSFREHSGDRR